MDEDIIKVQIDGVLDLHIFSPRDIKQLVPDYLKECRQKGILQVRIIHGKGIGTLRRTVHAILDRMSEVHSYRLADGSGGGWGATVADLRPMKKK